MAVLAECPKCRNKQSVRNKKCKCGEDLDQAKRSNRVDPLDLVMETAALWLLHCQIRGLVKSDLHLKYIMGSRLIRFIRYDGRTRGTEHLKCGEYVQKNIGVLLVTICRAVEKKYADRNI